MQNFQFHLWYNKLFTVNPCGASGGLTLLYNNDFIVNVVYESNRITDIESVINGKRVFYPLFMEI